MTKALYEKFKFRCWIANRKHQTVRVIEANSSFSARQNMASYYGVKTFEVVSQRVKLGEAVQS